MIEQSVLNQLEGRWLRVWCVWRTGIVLEDLSPQNIMDSIAQVFATHFQQDQW
jgi:hypothetical protein